MLWKAIKALLVLCLAAAATTFAVRRALPRLECNLAKGIVNRNMGRLWNTGEEYERITSARRNVESCRRCVALFPQDHHWHYLLGVNLVILDQREEAVASFERSLQLADRPEVYARLAETQVELGNVEAARAALLPAATFHYVNAEVVADPLRAEVQTVVLERYRRLTGKEPE